MNICILINSFNLGGAEKLMYDVAEVLAQKDENVFVVAMKKAETELEFAVKESIEQQGVKVFSIDKPVKKGRVKAVFSIATFLEKNKIDILHTNGQSPDFYGRLASALYRKAKTVVTIHSTEGYSKKVEKLLCGLTDRYTAVSKEAEEYSRRDLGIREIVTIENGIDFKRYEKTEEKTNKTTLDILSVGRIVPQKAYHTIMRDMCKYLKENENSVWTILGETQQDEIYFAQLIDMIDEKVKDRIIFTGAVSNPEEYYKKADCFILPSASEGFGIAYIEAMAAELPVVANKVGVMIDLVDAGRTFVEISGKSMTECINEAMKMSETEKRINKNFCKNMYSITGITERYREIYYELKR